MRRYQTVKINHEKFKEAIEAKAGDLYKASAMIGRSRKYLYNIYAGTSPCTLPTAKTIEGILGVSYDEYKEDETEEISRGGEAGISNISQGDLYETISDAVTDAFRSVKAEFQRVIYEAMKDALSGKDEP